MIYRNERLLKFKKSDLVPELSYLDKMADDDVDSLFHEVLNGGIHGFCFAPYEAVPGTSPIVSEEKIRKKLEILQPFTHWIRTFSCMGSNALIPSIAKEYGLKTLVGARLGNDEGKNQQELKSLIQLAKSGYVDIAAVGNEVLYQGYLNENQLLDYITQVEEQLPGIPVGYVDAYYEFIQRPSIVDACDVILCNCHPYWEGTHFKDSFQHLRQMYYQVKNVALGKKVIITETGWPNEGSPLGKDDASRNNAMKYFINTNLWSQDDNIEVFYFSSFDEPQDMENEGEAQSFWGIWNNSEKLKY